MSKETIADRLASSAAIMGMLPENPGWNGSVLLIDDEEAARVAKDLSDAYECVREQQAALEFYGKGHTTEAEGYGSAARAVLAKWRIE